MKKSTIYILPFLFLPLLSIGQGKRMEKAKMHYANYDYAKSLVLFEKVFSKNNNPEAACHIGDIYKQRRNYKAARTWYDLALMNECKSADCYFNYGIVLLSFGDYENARELFRESYILKYWDQRGKSFYTFCDQIIDGKIDSAKVNIQLQSFNSEETDFGPSYFEDGLLFCSERPNAVAGITYYSGTSNKPLLDIYYTKQNDSLGFGKARSFSAEINSVMHDGPVSFYAEDSILYFARSKRTSAFRIGSSPSGGFSIWSSIKKNNSWTKPVEILPSKNGISYLHPCVSPDGNYLYFASDMDGGMGGTDLYKLRLHTNIPSKPINLGSKINSSGNETFPFIPTYGTLYFSSDGYPGFGGQDIFQSHYVANNWSAPENLGPPFNSNFDDFSFICKKDEQTGYFSSNRESKNRNHDIYSFDRINTPFIECPEQLKNVLCYSFKEKGTLDSLPFMLTYQWDLGDGNLISGTEVEHCFEKPGVYNVKLMVVDSMTGNAVFNQASYTFNLELIEQAYITCNDTINVGENIAFDALESQLPNFQADAYFWDFGDGNTAYGAVTSHHYSEIGIYAVQLGIIGYNKDSHEPEQHCVVKTVIVQGGGMMAFGSTFEIETKAIERIESLENHFTLADMPDPDFRVQLGTSLVPIETTPENFNGLEGVEELHENEYYRYLYGNAKNFAESLELLKEVEKAGFTNPSVLTFNEDSLINGEAFEKHWLPGKNFDFTTIAGTVLDKDDNPLHANIIWENMESGEIVANTKVNNENGTFIEHLPKGNYYGYFADLDDYYPMSSNVDLRNYEGDLVIENEFRMVSVEEMIKENIPIRINNVFFSYDSYKLMKESSRELDRVVRFLLENPDLSIEISGHTDNHGSATYNLMLSTRRASSVAKYLVLNGCDPDLITFRGYGEDVPLASNEVSRGRKINRRVEFKILSIGSKFLGEAN